MSYSRIFAVDGMLKGFVFGIGEEKNNKNIEKRDLILVEIGIGFHYSIIIVVC